MNVDIDNFHEVRKYIADNDLIKKSKYISFDLQFTGVKFDNNQKERYDMFLNDKYQKMSSVASKYSIIQVGLTFVVPRSEITKDNKESIQKQENKQKSTQIQHTQFEKKEQEKDEVKKLSQKLQQANLEQKQQQSDYVAYPYNFYVFPRKSQTYDPVISMQAGSVEFNSCYDMDWNRWIRKGITYVRISQMNKHLQNISNSCTNAVQVTVTNSSTNSNQKLFLQVLNELNQKTKKIVEQIIKNCDNKEVGFKYTVQVPKPSVGHIRRAIQRYADQNNINYMLTTTKIQLSQDEQQQLNLQHTKSQNQDGSQSNAPSTHLINLTIQVISQQRKKQQQQKQKQSILGFTLLFKQIWNGNKTLVGHNCLYDLLFLYSSFVDELPRDYNNFKKILCDRNENCSGKQFYDTKYLAGLAQIDQKIFKKGTALEQLYKYFKHKQIKQKFPTLALAEGFQSYDIDKSKFQHEAGYDSYLTSWIFLHLKVSPQDQGKIGIFKSYFVLNLRTQSDQIRKDMKVFIIAIVLNNAYVPYDELRGMRITLSKLIRDQLFKDNMLNDVVVIDGFKQLFISMKEISKTDRLVQFLIRLKKDKFVNSNNVMSLQAWVKMKAEIVALTVANSQNQNKSTKNT